MPLTQVENTAGGAVPRGKMKATPVWIISLMCLGLDTLGCPPAALQGPVGLPPPIPPECLRDLFSFPLPVPYSAAASQASLLVLTLVGARPQGPCTRFSTLCSERMDPCLL